MVREKEPDIKTRNLGWNTSSTKVDYWRWEKVEGERRRKRERQKEKEKK